MPDLPLVPLPLPRLTARGVAAAVLVYLALALFYTLTLAWNVGGGDAGAVLASLLLELPRTLVDYALKAALTLPVWWLVVRGLDGRPVAQATAHLVLGPLWVAAWFVAYRAVAPGLGLFVLEGRAVAWDVYISALVYLAQFGLLHGARTVVVERERVRREARLATQAVEAEAARREADVRTRDAELAALRAQMDPHFLFNALNTVTAAIPVRHRDARDLVARLAGLMRYALGASRRPTVPLADEIDFVRDYLALEQARMGRRLHSVLDIHPDALAVEVPPMLLQPLVENAVRHGLAPLEEGGTVRVVARTERHDGRPTLCVTVSDDGAGPSRPFADLLGVGVGLANTDARLRSLGGGLDLTTGQGDGAPTGLTVTFSLPISAP